MTAEGVPTGRTGEDSLDAERDHTGGGVPVAARSPHFHSWRWDGDDPYIVCACGERRDTISGRVITVGSATSHNARGQDS